MVGEEQAAPGASASVRFSGSLVVPASLLGRIPVLRAPANISFI